MRAIAAGTSWREFLVVEVRIRHNCDEEKIDLEDPTLEGNACVL